ncbi:hypothetical protein RYO59_002467 [Thermosynechococcaceae cyanobacterium Okahandja]
MFDEDFAGRCLSFDEAAAIHYAQIAAHRIRLGRPMTVEAAQIAANALASRMVLATRNVREYEQINGLMIANPWVAPNKCLSVSLRWLASLRQVGFWVNILRIKNELRHPLATALSELPTRLASGDILPR